MYYSLYAKVKYFAIVSRIIVLLVQVSFNFLLPDHEPDVFVSPPDPELPISWCDRAVEFMIGGLCRWDAQYFMHIVQYGYSHENTLVFFPSFPIIIGYLSQILFIPLKYILNFHSVIILTATLFNNVLFVITAIVLFKLSREVLQNETLAYRASLLFCINPASIFFSAPYSETLFAFLTFSALYISESKGAMFGSLIFALSSATRSNGLVNVGFIFYYKLKDCTHYFYRIRNATTESGHLSLPLVLILTLNYTFIPLFVGSLLVVLPFGLYQLWCYWTYCNENPVPQTLPPHLELFIRSNFLHSPDLGEAEWCYNFPPLAYTHIQDKYWEVGFLKYYEAQQLPNFLLAFPIVLLVISHAALYFVDNPQVCWNLGVPSCAMKGNSLGGIWCKTGINSWKVFPYIVHSLLLCLFCVLFIHVQVTTRLLCSACPSIYWFGAYLMTDSIKEKPVSTSSPDSITKSSEVRPDSLSNMSRKYHVLLWTEFPKHFLGQVIVSYFGLYYFLGTIFFCNFLPWT